jgi:hypothetical protein
MTGRAGWGAGVGVTIRAPRLVPRSGRKRSVIVAGEHTKRIRDRTQQCLSRAQDRRRHVH